MYVKVISGRGREIVLRCFYPPCLGLDLLPCLFPLDLPFYAMALREVVASWAPRVKNISFVTPDYCSRYLEMGHFKNFHILSAYLFF